MATKCTGETDGEFKLTLPLFDNKGKKISKETYDYYIKQLNTRFGRTSSWRTKGCYNNEEGKTQCEGTVIIMAVRDIDSPYHKNQDISCPEKMKLLEEDCNFIKKISREAGKEFGQYSVISTCSLVKSATLIKGKFNKLSKKKLEELPLGSIEQKEYEPFQEVF